jgi:hypothetical protein
MNISKIKKEFEEKFGGTLEKWKLSPDFSYEYLIKETSNMVEDIIKQLLSILIQKEREEAVRGFLTELNKHCRITKEGDVGETSLEPETVLKRYLSQTKGVGND